MTSLSVALFAPFGPRPRDAASAPAPVPASTLDTLRRHSIRAWAVIGWVSVALLLVTDWLLGAGLGVPLLVVGVAVNVAPTWMALTHRHDAEARTVMGTLAAVLPAMLVFLLQGHAWQMDAHMYFFVSMAALVMLGDWRPLAVATALTATHHLLLEWLAPAWVFAGSGNLGRVLFHAVAVLLQFSALAFVTVRLQQLFTTQDEAIRRSGELLDVAEAERRRTQAAMDQARAAEGLATRERQARAEATARLRAERRTELVALAHQFERTVSSVVKAIGTATGRLEVSAVRLDEITAGTNEATDQAAADATRAAVEMGQVAASVRTLSHSIRTIAVAAGEQSQLTDLASGEAERSVRTIATLERQAAQIEAIVENIREIAGKTNLLALNATIEAARAGEAGRGFSVVAGEVKTLAADTTRASDKISDLLAAIRAGVGDTAAALRSVDGAIGEVAAAAGGIASAVGEQREAAQAVDAGASRAVDTSADIGRRIERLAGAAGTAASLSVEVRGSATDLAAIARDLGTSTDSFVAFLQEDGPVAA